MWEYNCIGQDDTLFIPYCVEICMIATQFNQHAQYNYDLIKQYQDFVNSHSSFYQLEFRLTLIATDRFDVDICYQDGDGRWGFNLVKFKYKTGEITLDQIKF